MGPILEEKMKSITISQAIGGNFDTIEYLMHNWPSLFPPFDEQSKQTELIFDDNLCTVGNFLKRSMNLSGENYNKANTFNQWWENSHPM